MADFRQIKWSGKEDSNLRPLPPENGSPAVTRRISVATRRTKAAPDSPCSRLVPQRGSYRTFGPCLPTVLCGEGGVG
jgi:hypothetical protein